MDHPSFPVVGIGASAGGLEAFHSFFDHLPADSGMAYVLILHLPADRKSALPSILERWTRMPVVEAEQGTEVKPDTLYIPPPHSDVVLSADPDGSLVFKIRYSEDNRLFRPIDTFFDSIGTILRERSVGIVLSGTGSDGALGLKAIKERGGLTIAQGSDGTAPQYPEMPAGAIATGAVDLVAPVDQMPGHLMRMRGSRLAELDSPHESARHVDDMRLRICKILREQVGHDFSGYRDKTFLRRVRRRMQVVDARTIEDYIAQLETDHEEVVALFRDLLIRVTSFFRDKETFEALETNAIPLLFEGKAADGTVRVWVPGCATGEEAYSLAMLLREHMDTLDAPPRVQLFATDIDDDAIDVARLGRYPMTLLEGLSPTRRERFFRPHRGGFVTSKEIRDLCIFSTHNLLHDPPFSRMDLVSCRNLLIYLDASAQAAVMPVLHYALRPGGLLLLGASESTAKHADLFEPFDKQRRIFVRRDVRSPSLKLQPHVTDLTTKLPVIGGPLAHHFRDGETAVSAHKTKGPGDSPRKPPAQGNGMEPGDDRRGGFRRLLDRFAPTDDPTDGLRRDLLSTQEAFQSLTEEHQTALEELRSANEELHSVNEEMQSTNEELETSKEELQSVNEELHTVNSRLSEKVDELDAANSDLRNLFESTEIAIVFLDRDLVIRNFTPAISALYNLLPGDQGRPLSDIVTRLDYADLDADVGQVFTTLQPVERRIAQRDRSAHYIMRILPYREPDQAVSGVLVTFIDVTSIVRAEEALRESDMRKDIFIATLSHELRNPLAPIRTAATMLTAPELTSPQMGRIKSIISRQVFHLTSLLDDLLDVSRIARSAVVLHKSRVNLAGVIEDAVETVRSVLDAKRHTLQVNLPARPLVIEVDPVRLTQVISNLLNNAGKYTRSGGNITIDVSLDEAHLRIAVRDDGIGIQREMLGRVFQMFTRVEPAKERVEQGLGIGLALVKGLVALHGGEVTAISDGLGKGSVFTVTLPASVVVEQEVTETAAGAVTRPAAHRPRVLIADDNVDGAESLQLLLGLSGHETFVAHTGEAALTLADHVCPDVVVLDIGLPDMLGYDVARQLRARPWGEKTTLIALTGWGQDRDVRTALAAGFDYHLTKPVDPDQLMALFPATPARR